MKLCVVMVNYNNSKLSCDCCDSLLVQQGINDLKIFIVDNNSKEEEKSILIDYTEQHENVECVFLDDNIGYFPAMEKGQTVAYAKKIDYDYMIVANNDLIYEKDFIETLRKQKFADDIMVISPDIVRMDGVHQNPHFVNRVSTMRKFLYHIYYSNWYVALVMDWGLNLFNAQRRTCSKQGYDEAQYIYMGFGACFILTKLYMRIIGHLDTRSFLMGEESLLTQQVHENRGRIYYAPVLKVKHLDSATFKQRPTRFAYECMRQSYKLYKDNL